MEETIKETIITFFEKENLMEDNYNAEKNPEQGEKTEEVHYVVLYEEQ